MVGNMVIDMDKPKFPKKHPGICHALIDDLAEAIVEDLRSETDPKELAAFFTFDKNASSDIRQYVAKETYDYVDYIIKESLRFVKSEVYNMLTDPKYSRYHDDLPSGWNWYTGKTVDEETEEDEERDDELRFSH